jgi:hypothetical protein
VRTCSKKEKYQRRAILSGVMRVLVEGVLVVVAVEVRLMEAREGVGVLAVVKVRLMEYPRGGRSGGRGRGGSDGDGRG